MDKLKPYMKVLTLNPPFACCAIYEPHPFGASAITDAVRQTGREPKGSTDIDDDTWCWVYYNWCGNPVGLSDTMPVGTVVDAFTVDNLGDQSLADYLNYENPEAVEAWHRRTEE